MNRLYRRRLEITLVCLILSLVIIPNFESRAVSLTTNAVAIEYQLPSGSQVLSPENASQAQQLAQLGRGRIIDMHIAAGGKVWVIQTPFGLHLYQSTDGRDIFFIPEVDHFIYSPDERYVLTTTRGSGSVKIWDVNSGVQLASLEHSSTQPRYPPRDFDLADFMSPTALTYSPDGKWLAVAYGDLQIIIWDTAKWKQEKLLTSNVAVRADRLLFSSDGRYLLAQSPLALAIWSFPEGKLIKRTPNFGRLSDHPFSPDGKLIVASSDRQVRVYTFPTGRLILSFGFDGYPDVSFSQDGKYLLVDGQVRRLENGTRLSPEQEQKVLYPNGTPNPSADTPAQPAPDWGKIGHWQGLQGGEFTSNQSILTWGIQNGQILFYRQFPGENTDEAILDQLPLHKAVISPDQRTIAVCTVKQLILFGIQDGTLRSYPGCRKNGVLDFLDDQVLGRASNVIIDWVNPVSGILEHNLNGHKQMITALEFSGDREWLASGTNVRRGGSEIIIWKLKPVIRYWDQWKVTANLAVGDTAEVQTLAFSPDSSLLAVGGADSTVKLYRIKDKWLLKVMHVANTAIDLTFSPDGKLLAAAGSDGSIFLWSIPDGQAVNVLQGHQESVVTVAFSPDGKTLLSTSEDGTLRLWGIP